MCFYLKNGENFIPKNRIERKMIMKKLSLKDELQALAAGIGIVGGLFAFSLILGIVFMDYDPRTMLENIERDLRLLFG